MSDKEIYQNILAQMHELNRQNLLTEYERNENIVIKLTLIEEEIKKKQTKNDLDLTKKILFIIISLLGVNIILTLFLLFSSNNEEKTLKNEPITKENIVPTLKEPNIDNTIIDIEDKTLKNEKTIISNEKDITVFDKKKIEIEEEFTEVKPIIKVGTSYTCEDDNYMQKYKIPYTVEIKGKLYTDRFVFILKNGSERKVCKINKLDM